MAVEIAPEPDDVIAELLAAVSYLRIAAVSAGAGGAAEEPREWLSCAELLARPERLTALTWGTKPARGTNDDTVALSLFMQGYAFRIASAAIGSFVLCGNALDVDPETTSLALGEYGPNAVRLDRPSLVRADGDIAVLHDVLVERHLAPLVDACRRTGPIGDRLLWSNVASSCAASFGALVGPRADDRDRLRTLAERFFATARLELHRAGRLVRLGTGTRWVWERAACCLYYRTDKALQPDGEPRKCNDCSLSTPAERSARYAELLDAEAIEGD